MSNTTSKDPTNATSPPTLTSLLTLPSSTRSQILDEALKAYPSFISPKLAPLDTARYETIPNLLKSQSHLSKPDLLQLVDWKLSHGKFRPTLRKLVDSNPENVIVETTRRGIEALRSNNSEDVKTALNVLCELRGIGPATASLVLSCADPKGTVFFGDEVAEWVCPKLGAGKLKYNAKEYLELCERVREVKGELGLSAVEVEKVGYVFGKRAKGEVDGGEGVKGAKGKAGEEEKVERPTLDRAKDLPSRTVKLMGGKRKAAAAAGSKKDVVTGKEEVSTESEGCKRVKVEKTIPEGKRRSTRSKTS